MRDDLWAFGWHTPLVIVAVLAVYLLLAGCATTLADRRELTWTDCDGRARHSWVEIREGIPLTACPLSVAIQLPLACTVFSPGRAVIILPPHAPDWLLEHELMHVQGYEHAIPGFLWPMIRGCDGA